MQIEGMFTAKGQNNDEVELLDQRYWQAQGLYESLEQIAEVYGQAGNEVRHKQLLEGRTT